VTNRVYATNSTSSNVTVIDVDGSQKVPLTQSVAGVVDPLTVSTTNVFQTKNSSPQFTDTVTSAYTTSAAYSSLPGTTNPRPTAVYYTVDGINGGPALQKGTATSSSGANPGTYNITLSPQAVGLHTLYLYAAYGNEGGHNTGSIASGNSPELSNLGAYAFLILSVPTTTTVMSDDNPQIFGSQVTFTATVVPAAQAARDPTGTVSFYDGATLLGTGTLSKVSGSFIATFATSTLSVGTHSITAAYSGDANYSSSTSAVLSQVVNQAPGSVTLSASPNPVVSGSPVALTATVPAGQTGTVTFYDGTTVLGTSTISGTTATLSVPNFSPGTHSITAGYNGDTNHTTATSSAVSLVVTSAADFSIAIQTPSQTISPGASASYTVALTSVNGAFTNVVTLTAANLPPGSSYTFMPTTLTPGSTGATSTFMVSVPKQSGVLDRDPRTRLLVAVLLLPLTVRRVRARPPRLLLWLLFSLGTLGSVVGCGGSGGNHPAQIYNIMITATSGNLVRSTTATLTVQ